MERSSLGYDESSRHSQSQQTLEITGVIVIVIVIVKEDEVLIIRRSTNTTTDVITVLAIVIATSMAMLTVPLL